MAAAIATSSTYESGSGGYLAVHTWPSIDVSGSNTLHLVCGINRNPATDATSWTSEGNAMTLTKESVNANVCAVSIYQYLINDSTVVAVSNTPSYKLQGGFSLGLTGVDQTTPVTGTPTATGGFSTTARGSYTGTAGNLLLIFGSTQNDKTFTASNCTLAATITHADGNCGSGFVGYVDATGSSQTNLGASFTTNDNWRISIVEIKAATGASVVIKDIIGSGFFAFPR